MRSWLPSYWSIASFELANAYGNISRQGALLHLLHTKQYSPSCASHLVRVSWDRTLEGTLGCEM
eukprot:m.25525 g.25525  ORF g.25525 m.25525 type:complete len:64 (+) comp37414_c0_seq2:648-839(+)